MQGYERKFRHAKTNWVVHLGYRDSNICSSKSQNGKQRNCVWMQTMHTSTTTSKHGTNIDSLRMWSPKPINHPQTDWRGESESDYIKDGKLSPRTFMGQWRNTLPIITTQQRRYIFFILTATTCYQYNLTCGINDIILKYRDNICTGFTGSMDFHKRTSCSSFFVCYLFAICVSTAPVVATDPMCYPGDTWASLQVQWVHWLRYQMDMGSSCVGHSPSWSLPPVPQVWAGLSGW